jgi:putative oxidoreductase
LRVIGALALVLGVYAQIASILLAIFMIVVSFAVLTFWSPGDPAPVRAQKLNSFAANIAIVGGLIYVIAAGSGRLSLIR